jgi:hypothetical protein
MQFVAVHDAVSGIYMASYDTEGYPKQFGVLRPSGDDYELKIEHLCSIAPKQGKQKVPYPCVLGTFTGGWQGAADLYKSWALNQWWCKRRWVDRPDTPKWLKDSPAALIYFMLNREDNGWRGPVKGVKNADRVAGDIEAWSKRLGVPIFLWPLDWEKNGAWIGQDYLPPYLGWDEFDKLSARLATGGHHGSINLSGYRWTYEWYVWPDDSKMFSSEKRLREQFGDAIRLKQDGSWSGRKASGWEVFCGISKSTRLCRAHRKTKAHINSVVRQMTDHGWDMIHFDQENAGGANHALCYATNHGHEPGWGKYAYEGIRDLLAGWKQQAKAKGAKWVLSIEEPAEALIPWLDTYQCRNFFGDSEWGPWDPAVPLFAYVYHEFLPGFACAIGWGSSPGFALHAVARGAVYGDIPGIARSDPPTGGSEDEWGASEQFVADWCRARAGFAKDYLAFGVMGRPLDLNVPVDRRPAARKRESLGKGWEVDWPTVHIRSWKTPDGRWGAVLASSVLEPVRCRVSVDELPKANRFELLSTSGKTELTPKDGKLSFDAPPLKVLLLRPLR